MGEPTSSRSRRSTSNTSKVDQPIGVASRKGAEEEKKKDGFNIASMLVLLYFSTAMVVLPLGVYFLIYWYIIKSTTIAALGAVVMVQLIIAAFIYKAWHDERTEDSQCKSKDKKQL